MNKITFYTLTFLLILALSAFGISHILAGVIGLILMMSVYLYFNINRNKNRLRLLNEKCDPLTFLKLTEEQINNNQRNKKVVTYLNIDKSAGLVALGRFQEAKDLLLTLSKQHLSVKNGSRQIYIINLLTCMYELGELDQAEEYYQENVQELNNNSSQLSLAIDLLNAERLFFLNHFLKSEQQLSSILNRPVSTRARLSILYRLALIDFELGREKEAQTKLQEVVEKGNKLYIAERALYWQDNTRHLGS